VKPGPPAIAELGFKDVSVGAGLLTVNVAAFDTPPSSVGPKTSTCEIPATARSEALIAACNSVLETKVVGRGLVPDPVPEGFHWTVEEGKKSVPVTVSVNAGPPAIAELGSSAVIAGGLTIVTVTAFDVPPPGEGVKTVTAAVPAVATSENSSCAPRVVAE